MYLIVMSVTNLTELNNVCKLLQLVHEDYILQTPLDNTGGPVYPDHLGPPPMKISDAATDAFPL